MFRKQQLKSRMKATRKTNKIKAIIQDLCIAERRGKCSNE